MYKYLLNLILWLGALSSINACMVTDDEKTATSDQSSNIISVDKNAQSKQDLDEIHNLILHSALAKEFEKYSF